MLDVFSDELTKNKQKSPVSLESETRGTYNQEGILKLKLLNPSKFGTDRFGG